MTITTAIVHEGEPYIVTTPTPITNDHALALIALHTAEAEGDRQAITEARIIVAQHEALARRALLTPEQRAKLELVTANVGTLLAHTHCSPPDKKGRQSFFIEPEYHHLTLKERT